MKLISDPIYDLDTKEIRFDSIINNKPGENNSSEIFDLKIREEFEQIARQLLRQRNNKY